MEAAATSVSRPSDIDEIRTAATRSEFESLTAKAAELELLKASATSTSEWEAIAGDYASDNDQLRAQVSQRDERVAELSAELHEANDDRRRLRYQLQKAAPAPASSQELSPDPPETDDSDPEPTPGEVRFFKKIHSTPKYDVLEQVGGCDHNSWQSSHSADKARKGLERLRLPAWKRLQHCGSCTGGGMWRVEW
jgi:hypothetical protein